MASVITGGSVAFNVAATVARPWLMVGTRRAWSGAQHLPGSGGFVVVSNHISHADPFVLAHYLVDNGQVPHFLGKIEVFTIPVIGAVLRAAEQIPVYRESAQAGQAYRAAVRAVQAGQCVVAYPEGTLTREPDQWPMKGKTGAARIALETGCPIIPVAQWGAQDLLPPYARFPRRGRHTMQVCAGPPVDLSAFRDRPPDHDLLEAATEAVMTALTTQLEELRGASAPPGRFDPDAHGLTRTGKPGPRKE